MFHSTLFHQNVDEMAQERNSCLYQLTYGKIGDIIHCFT